MAALTLSQDGRTSNQAKHAKEVEKLESELAKLRQTTKDSNNEVGKIKKAVAKAKENFKAASARKNEEIWSKTEEIHVLMLDYETAKQELDSSKARQTIMEAEVTLSVSSHSFSY